MKSIAAIAVVAIVFTGTAARAEMVRSPDGKVVKFIQRAHPRIDYAHLKPVPMPMLRRPVPSPIDLMIAASKDRPTGLPEIVPGGEGNGKLTPVVLVPSPQVGAPATPDQPPRSQDGSGDVPPEYGGAGQTYTTSRAPSVASSTYRKAGLVAAPNEYCSGSLIKRGIVLTAAHCIYDWENNSFYGGWQYTPAYANGSGPYGTWDTITGYLPDDFYDRSNPDCDSSHVTCTDDVGLLVIQPNGNGAYPGDSTGWFGYAVNSYGFLSGQAQITQLGYPSGLDNGMLMERTDSRGFTDTTNYNNTIIGTLFNPGGSGGPFLVNFGTAPVADSDVAPARATRSNIVVGVASWYNGNRQNGASPFLSSNIQTLLNYACGDYPTACAKPASGN